MASANTVLSRGDFSLFAIFQQHICKADIKYNTASSSLQCQLLGRFFLHFTLSICIFICRRYMSSGFASHPTFRRCCPATPAAPKDLLPCEWCERTSVGKCPKTSSQCHGRGSRCRKIHRESAQQWIRHIFQYKKGDMTPRCKFEEEEVSIKECGKYYCSTDQTEQNRMEQNRMEQSNSRR